MQSITYTLDVCRQFAGTHMDWRSLPSVATSSDEQNVSQWAAQWEGSHRTNTEAGFSHTHIRPLFFFFCSAAVTLQCGSILITVIMLWMIKLSAELPQSGFTALLQKEKQRGFFFFSAIYLKPRVHLKPPLLVNTMQPANAFYCTPGGNAASTSAEWFGFLRNWQEKDMRTHRFSCFLFMLMWSCNLRVSGYTQRQRYTMRR